MVVYMAVETDKYELPLYVADTTRELAEWANIPVRTARKYIYSKRSGKYNRIKLIKVEINE